MNEDLNHQWNSFIYIYEQGKDDWDQKVPKHLVKLSYNGKLQERTRQIILINQILADDVNYGINSDVIDIEIKNMKRY